MIPRVHLTDKALKKAAFEHRILGMGSDGYFQTEATPPGTHDWSVRDTVVGNLHLRFTPGAATWSVVAKFKGSSRRWSIAHFLTVRAGRQVGGMTLAAARNQALIMGGLLGRGEDPAVVKDEISRLGQVERARKLTTMSIAYDAYQEGKREKSRAGTVADRAKVPKWMKGSPLWSTSIVDVDVAAVHKTFQPLLDFCMKPGAEAPKWGPTAVSAGTFNKLFTYTSAAYKRAAGELKLGAGQTPFQAWRGDKAWPQTEPREKYLQTGTPEGQAWLKALVDFQQRAHAPEVLEQRADPRGQGMKPHVSVLVDFFLCVLLFGTRKVETAKLTWRDVKFQERFVLFRETKSGKPGMVPLTPWATEILQARKETNHRWRPDRESPWVFPSRQHGKPLSNPTRIMETLMEETGVYIRPHDLRRTLATDFGTLEFVQADLARLLVVGAALNHQRGRTGSVPAASTPQYIQEQADIVRPRYQEREDKLRKIAGLPLLSPSPASTGKSVEDSNLDALIERAKTDPELKRRLMERMLS